MAVRHSVSGRAAVPWHAAREGEGGGVCGGVGRQVGSGPVRWRPMQRKVLHERRNAGGTT